MKIAFTAKGTEWDSQMDPRFGRTEFIVIYDDEKDEMKNVDNRDIEGVAHGAGPQTAQKLFDLKPDVLITGNGPGGNAGRVLQQANMKIFIGAGNMTVKEAYEAFKDGKLSNN
ncbi:MAG: dinitrogenase iron-molybdenum cofactor biosynthesis protein [Candidatus Cloacimonetes bacterium]|nr:dinitrogenase iron-molybdenum cofactor biosynthesis protein [Candidatus Cloacimonadota bacterium]MCF7813889.1 dinitrogenase iron-molybdenum cofactor biosynthesis protein [Candidatus Cloacimonadota bacterium]MCF7868900.1 dinitrogenase iron-molybdenum cofactor biosynthesis protein [Candidatus Cloacimonadota bacterium]MCF7884001.1 dinitrogenase iron-molybdenum cofactor biosynthesis protein [Candidatus Cloacimonadota bacterium]